jgi:hypothetical protein
MTEGCCVNCLSKRSLKINKSGDVINKKCKKCGSRMFEFFVKRRIR